MRSIEDGPHRGASLAEAGLNSTLDLSVIMKQHAQSIERLAAFKVQDTRHCISWQPDIAQLATAQVLRTDWPSKFSPLSKGEDWSSCKAALVAAAWKWVSRYRLKCRIKKYRSFCISWRRQRPKNTDRSWQSMTHERCLANGTKGEDTEETHTAGSQGRLVASSAAPGSLPCAPPSFLEACLMHMLLLKSNQRQDSKSADTRTHRPQHLCDAR